MSPILIFLGSAPDLCNRYLLKGRFFRYRVNFYQVQNHKGCHVAFTDVEEQMSDTGGWLLERHSFVPRASSPSPSKESAAERMMIAIFIFKNIKYKYPDLII